MVDRIEKLEREQRRLRRYALSVSALLLVAAVAAFVPREQEIIRARGIVIVDNAGRERILIGAPVPAARNRVRTDLARVRQAWADRFPNAEQYMAYYAKYRNDMNGILLLDANGFDRVAFGDPVPDPNIGRRIAPSSGFVVNDSLGFERTGYGLLNVAGNYRVVLGLDSNRGTESVVLSVFDDGPAGLSVGGEKRSLFLGAAPGKSFVGNTAALLGLALREGNQIRQQVSLEPSK